MYLETKLKIARAELYEERDEDEQQDAPSDYVCVMLYCTFLACTETFLDSIRRAVGVYCQFRKVGRFERGKSFDGDFDRKIKSSEQIFATRSCFRYDPVGLSFPY
jgi:hypothetical protein